MPLRQLRPDPTVRDLRPPQICWKGEAGSWLRQGESFLLAFPFSLASPCGRSARRLTPEPDTQPGAAPTLPELFNTRLLQNEQPELLFY